MSTFLDNDIRNIEKQLIAKHINRSFYNVSESEVL